MKFKISIITMALLMNQLMASNYFYTLDDKHYKSTIKIVTTEDLINPEAPSIPTPDPSLPNFAYPENINPSGNWLLFSQSHGQLSTFSNLIEWDLNS
jgi:hypothetical protein